MPRHPAVPPGARVTPCTSPWRKAGPPEHLPAPWRVSFSRRRAIR
jgi:hypothetical protein